MKTTIVSIACLLVVACTVSSEARPKRSIVLASPVVSSVPVAHSASIVRPHPSTLVKTEQVHNGDHSTYTYSSEVKSHPLIQTHTQAVAPVVSTVHHAVPSYYTYTGYYPSIASYPHYVVGK